MKKLSSSLILAFTTVFIVNSPNASALTIKGVTFPDITPLAGKKLKLIGGGKRTKLVFDVYAMATYTKSGICKPKAIINKPEPKSIQLVMLRDVDAKTMAESIGSAFKSQIGGNKKLQQKQKRFEGFFKTKLTSGTKIAFNYIPKKGLTIKQDGKKLGTIKGKKFMEAFFKIYFSKKTCCPGLQKQVLSCKK